MAFAAHSRLNHRLGAVSAVPGRRRAMLVVGAAALVIASIAGLSKSVSGTWSPLANFRPSLSSLPSALAILAERSPGERTTAELTKLKKRRLAANAAKPRERALGKIFTPQQSALFKALTPTTELAMAPLVDVVPTSLAPTGIPGFLTPAAEVPPVVVAAGPGGGGGGSGGGAGGGGGGGGGTTTTPPGDVPTVPSAVPEPGTWATMLLGFAMLGFAFRSRRSEGSELIAG